MQQIQVNNLKCGGCSRSITSKLQSHGVKNIKVDVDSGLVSFDGDQDLVKETLDQMGYPEVGIDNSNTFIKKAKSYASCIAGRLSN